MKKVLYGPLLDKNGNLAETGYVFSLVKEYKIKQIKGLKWRIKECDCYFFSNQEYGLALTVADNYYMWLLVGATFFDFKAKTEETTNLKRFSCLLKSYLNK